MEFTFLSPAAFSLLLALPLLLLPYLLRQRHKQLVIPALFLYQDISAPAQQLQTAHRPGKAIWISDFLFPLSVLRATLSLLRGMNSDIALIQVLGHEEIDPPLFPAGARMVDSENGEGTLVYFDARAKQTYMKRLDRHNRELQSSCHQAGVHYAYFVTHQDLLGFILHELPALGLLR